MSRRATTWSAVALAVLAASTTAAAATSIDGAARVADRARRLHPTFEPDLLPEERAASEMIALINTERSARGLPFLYADPRVTEAAHAHAVDMAANRRMQHLGSDGSDGGVRLTRAGYVWAMWAENIGAGFTDPRVLFDTWMASASHRDNLLGEFVHVGVGAVVGSDGAPYWALLVAWPPYGPSQP